MVSTWPGWSAATTSVLSCATALLQLGASGRGVGHCARLLHALGTYVLSVPLVWARAQATSAAATTSSRAARESAITTGACAQHAILPSDDCHSICYASLRQ